MTKPVHWTRDAYPAMGTQRGHDIAMDARRAFALWHDHANCVYVRNVMGQKVDTCYNTLPSMRPILMALRSAMDEAFL